MAIPAQRDRVPDSVVGRVAVHVMDLQGHVFAAAVGATSPVGREDPRPELGELTTTGPTRPVLAGAPTALWPTSEIGAIGKRAAV